jgi:prevent-host-death family protein
MAPMSTETISLTELRPRISELVERAHREFERFVITRHGRAEAVLLAADELEGLLETIEVLSDRDLVKRLIEAEEELLEGGGHGLDEIRAALADRGGS